MSFKLSNEAEAETFIDARENDKDVREIDIHLAEVLRLVDTYSTLRLRTLRTADLYNEHLNLCGGERVLHWLCFPCSEDPEQLLIPC